MPEIYYPVAQVQIARRAYAVGVSGRPEDAMPQIAEVVRNVDPTIGLLEFSPLRDAVGGSVSRPRFFTTLLSLFGLTALALGAVGVWGVTAHGVRLSRRALGIRLALGATDTELVRQTAVQGLVPVALGTAIGLAGFWFSARLFGSFLFNIEPRDPLTFAVVPALLLLVGFLAVAGPALRTRALQPASILREE
jgi:putative ABC transport system permease protein